MGVRVTVVNGVSNGGLALLVGTGVCGAVVLPFADVVDGIQREGFPVLNTCLFV